MEANQIPYKPKLFSGDIVLRVCLYESTVLFQTTQPRQIEMTINK